MGQMIKVENELLQTFQELKTLEIESLQHAVSNILSIGQRGALSNKFMADVIELGQKNQYRILGRKAREKNYL